MSFDRYFDNDAVDSVADTYVTRLQHLVGLLRPRTGYTEIEDAHVGPDGAHRVDTPLEDVPWCNLHQRAYLEDGEE